MQAAGVGHFACHGGGEEADALKQGSGHIGDVAGYHHHGHGLADGSAHAQHYGGGNAAFGGGDGDTEIGLLRRRAQRKGSVLVFLRHRFQCGDGHFDNGGQNHHGQDDDGGEQAGAVGNVEELPQSRHQHHHADKAVNHGGNARQHGDCLLHKAFDGLWRHFRQIHRRQESDGYADDDSPGGSVDAGKNKGKNAVFRLRRRGRPFLAEQEMEQADLTDGGNSGNN